MRESQSEDISAIISTGNWDNKKWNVGSEQSGGFSLFDSWNRVGPLFDRRDVGSGNFRSDSTHFGKFRHLTWNLHV